MVSTRMATRASCLRHFSLMSAPAWGLLTSQPPPRSSLSPCSRQGGEGIGWYQRVMIDGGGEAAACGVTFRSSLPRRFCSLTLVFQPFCCIFLNLRRELPLRGAHFDVQDLYVG